MVSRFFSFLIILSLTTTLYARFPGQVIASKVDLLFELILEKKDDQASKTLKLSGEVSKVILTSGDVLEFENGELIKIHVNEGGDGGN